jgi:hypothetical protein
MSDAGALRQAEAVLRSGGFFVRLRMPAPAVAGDNSEELGLATPEFQEIVLGPAAFRKSDSAKVLLVSASSVLAAVGTLAYESAEVLFETAAGLSAGGVLYEIVDSVAVPASGQPYSYALTLQAPVR